MNGGHMKRTFLTLLVAALLAVSSASWGADALIERLMHTSPDSTRDISVHTFFAAVSEVLNGRLTNAQVKTFLNVTPADEAEYDQLAALVTGSDGAKAIVVQGFHSIFLLAEVRVTGYETESDVRDKLGLTNPPDPSE